MFKIKIKNTTYGVSFSFFFVVALVSVCSGTQADMLFVTLMCCALHELGHLVLMTAFGSSPQEIVVYGGGIRISPDDKQLSKYHELAVLFAGPAVNFMLCLLSYMANGGGFFCQVNLLRGTLNLLPFRYTRPAGERQGLRTFQGSVYPTLSCGNDLYDPPRHCERFFCRNFLLYRPLRSHILTLCLLLL